MQGPSHKPNCLMEMSPNISQVPSLWPASEKAGIAFSYDSFLAKTQLGHGSLKINEVMVEKELYKVQLSLYLGPQDPVTFSSPEQPAREVCLLPLGMIGQIYLVSKYWSIWKWLTVSSHCFLFCAFSLDIYFLVDSYCFCVFRTTTSFGTLLHPHLSHETSCQS